MAHRGDVSRQDFLRFTVIFAGAAAAAALSGCSSSSSGGGSSPCSNGAKDTAISSNHGHALTIPAADVAKAAGGTYSIKGQAEHDHTVTLTGDQLKTLASGGSVTVQSSLNVPGADHQHNVTIGCA